MFDQSEKARALLFAQALTRRDYTTAYLMLSGEQQLHTNIESLKELFEDMIPLDWGSVDPIELEESDEFPFVYVVLGGEVYSEAVVIDSFVVEGGEIKINNFEFGRL